MKTNIQAISNRELNDMSNYLYAEPNDICYKINNTLCLCNLEHECYNIGIETIKPTITVVRDLFRFIYILYSEYDINYVSVRQKVVWPVLNRLKGYTDKETGIVYYKISENIDQVKKEMKYTNE